MSAAVLTVRVARKTREAQEIVSFEFVRADGLALPAFAAGAHIDVHVPGGFVRQYSLCNSPAEQHRYLIAVLREPSSRGGSAALHERVREGDVLTISPPRNLFAIEPSARRHLLLAGGIGITPLLSMAEQLAADGADFTLHYCTRGYARTAFYDHLRASAYADRVRFHIGDGRRSQRLDFAALLRNQPDGTHLYVCGPPGFIEDALAAARSLGWSEKRLHHERFIAAPAASAGDRPFEVQIAGSGRVVAVPTGVTVVKALAAAGIEIPTSCEQGICGTCLTPVLEGIPDHRDQYLTADEQAAGDRFLPCCSRAKSDRLVLKL